MARRRAMADMGVRLPDPAFWKDQRVFVTGHTGFKGGWLSIWLRMLGATVGGYALRPDTTPALFDVAGIADLVASQIGDIRDRVRLTEAMAGFRPSVVIHMAAQPLVRRSYQVPHLTFETNVMGTVNVLEAARSIGGIGAVFIVTSDKCYEMRAPGRPHLETDRLGGRDPYSASKACAELVTRSYFHSFFMHSDCGLATGRAGNVIGGGDWAEDRLLPDLVRAFQAGRTAVLRHPDAIRPWQHVLEPLNGYLLGVERIFGRPGDCPAAWNFGPDAADSRTVGQVARVAADVWGGGATVESRDDAAGPYEAGWLSVGTEKAREQLGWAPRWALDEAIRRKIGWVRAFDETGDALGLCREDIQAFRRNCFS